MTRHYRVSKKGIKMKQWVIKINVKIIYFLFKIEIVHKVHQQTIKSGSRTTEN